VQSSLREQEAIPARAQVLGDIISPLLRDEDFDASPVTN
jgi:hypothetical protein